MNKHKFTKQENQDVFDLAIQEFGTVESIFSANISSGKATGTLIETARAVLLFFYLDIPTGTKIELVNTEKIGDRVTVNKIKSTNFVVNNSGSVISATDGGIGVWVVEDTFVVQ